MKALISLILSSMLLNLSVHAGSSSENSDSAEAQQEKAKKSELEKNQDAWEKQKMEEATDTPHRKTYYPGFEYNPRPYSPSSTPQERIQTED
jgi:hypothetical protein